MKRNAFIGKLLLIISLLILSDMGLGLVLEHFYFKIRHGEQGRMTYAIDSCVSNLIILGSSRAAHHYVSPIISKKLNISCYNAGKDKQALWYCLAMLKMMNMRYSPKEIILDLNPTAFETIENGFDDLSVLLPYYRGHKEIRSIINNRSRFEWLKTYSGLYCFNSLPPKILFNNLSDERDQNEKSGYVPLDIRKEAVPSTPEDIPSTMSVDSGLVSCFKMIIRLTKEKKSRLIVVVSPIYYQLPHNLPTLELAKSICGQEKVAFLDYSQSPVFLNHGPEMFVDEGHLNDSSATLFSTMLCDDLKKIR